MTTDQEFIHSLTQDFFGTKRVHETLTLITDCGISGWEKWLQIELAGKAVAEKAGRGRAGPCPHPG